MIKDETNAYQCHPIIDKEGMYKGVGQTKPANCEGMEKIPINADSKDCLDHIESYSFSASSYANMAVKTASGATEGINEKLADGQNNWKLGGNPDGTLSGGTDGLGRDLNAKGQSGVFAETEWNSNHYEAKNLRTTCKVNLFAFGDGVKKPVTPSTGCSSYGGWNGSSDSYRKSQNNCNGQPGALIYYVQNFKDTSSKPLAASDNVIAPLRLPHHGSNGSG
ncbi:MAG: hypothetical protein LBP35_02290 [Candidatus Ancillula trichonymphae]|nr:hypothetical protein [Candidatus Ancillula trichonymphae]